MFNIGDLVIIISDSNQFIYKIKEISDKVCLVGNSYRVIKYVDIGDNIYILGKTLSIIINSTLIYHHQYLINQ